MEKNEFMDEIEMLDRSYHNAFPQDRKERAAIAAIWYDHFSHIPKDLFAKAAKYCREHERFLSIASLRESIVQVADVPKGYEIREELNGEPTHPIAKRIYKVLDLQWLDAEMTDFAFEREFKRAREEYVEMIMRPENVALLAGEQQLEGHHE